MIKTAKMHGNVMVSAGGRGARGREDRLRGTSAGDERGTHTHPPPRGADGDPVCAPPPDPTGIPQRRPPGCGGSAACLQIATLRPWVPVVWTGGSGSGARAGCARWGRGGGAARAGRASVPARGGPPGPCRGGGGGEGRDPRRAGSPRPGQDRWARMPAPALPSRSPGPVGVREARGSPGAGACLSAPAAAPAAAGWAGPCSRV